MNVEITFEPAGLSGLVAPDSYVIDAAKRMGVRLRADCHERGECTACVVSIAAGQSLLSDPTDAEKKMLAEERLVRGERLACQARIETAGQVVVRVMPEQESNETTQKEKRDVKQAFRELSLKEKLLTLAQLEVMTMSATMDSVIEKSQALVEQTIDRFAAKQKSMNERKSKRPTGHRKESS